VQYVPCGRWQAGSKEGRADRLPGTAATALEASAGPVQNLNSFMFSYFAHKSVCYSTVDPTGKEIFIFTVRMLYNAHCKYNPCLFHANHPPTVNIISDVNQEYEMV
jgi:hypothetical protein